MGPVLCAGVTAYKALLNADIIKGEYFVVMGAGGGLGHFVIQYGLALGAKIIAIGSGDAKKALVESYGVKAFVNFTNTKDIVGDVLYLLAQVLTRLLWRLVTQRHICSSS